MPNHMDQWLTTFEENNTEENFKLMCADFHKDLLRVCAMRGLVVSNFKVYGSICVCKVEDLALKDSVALTSRWSFTAHNMETRVAYHVRDKHIQKEYKGLILNELTGVIKQLFDK